MTRPTYRYTAHLPNSKLIVEADGHYSTGESCTFYVEPDDGTHHTVGTAYQCEGWTREEIVDEADSGTETVLPQADTESIPLANLLVPSPINPRVGDRVRRRDGGGAMSIYRIERGSILCRWEGEKGELFEQAFDPDDLVAAGAIDEAGKPVEPAPAMNES